MAAQQNRFSRRTSRLKRSSAKKPPMPHVISLRVNDQEKQLLEQLSKKRAKNLSAVVREALEYWLAR